VAVIVAESSQVTIYDGDDPDLPMWMVFNQGGSWSSTANLIMPTSASDPLAISLLNGVLSIGFSNGYGFGILNFISEHNVTLFANVTQNYRGNISQRNDQLGFSVSSDTRLIVNSAINDVAMTVLPNAPIDSATGLPVPTIAVATNGGVSVIKDDGTVVSGTSSSSYPCTDVSLRKSGELYIGIGSTNTGVLYYSNFTDISGVGINTFSNADTFWYGSVNNVGNDSHYLGSTGVSVDALSANEEDNLTIATPSGVTHVSVNNAALDNGMVAYTASDYATGWMNGDIKLATLSDTDDADVTGTELVTNGTFDSNTSGWTSTDGNISHQSGALRLQGDGSSTSYPRVYQAITTVAGKTYTVSADMVGGNAIAWYLRIDTGSGGNGNLYNSNNLTAATHAGTFTATGTTTYIILQVTSPVPATNYRDFDNISVRLAEEDRSVNGNGLQVFGTVTKNPVATGADLVAYSGFSGSNYLQQPYNADLDFGTGDFVYMGWATPATSGTYRWMLAYGDGDRSSGNRGIGIRNITSATTMEVRLGADTLGFTVPSSGWFHLVVLRRNGIQEVYVNGVLNASSTSVWTTTITGATLRLGNGSHHSFTSVGSTSPWTGSLALWRISATAPSPEQIAKIYEDEKVLFQDGAQATLYGTSDAVTALAHDDTTDLLHVGTSAGRSVFQGLRRVDNTTTAVGAAISASNGLVAED
jgi:hypothetical protein